MERVCKGRVLLIEDDAAFLAQMEAAFEAAGFSVRVASDGDEGLRVFRDWRADLVVTDMIMPVREGVETILALRQSSPTVKIVAISDGLCAGPEYYLTLAHHLGADQTLAKPFDMAELAAAAERMLGDGETTAPRDVSPQTLVTVLALAEQLDDAVILARLLLDRRPKETQH